MHSLTRVTNESILVSGMRNTPRVSALAATGLLLASAFIADAAGEQQRTLSFSAVPLSPSQGIVAIELTITCGRLATIHILNDWGVHVECPVGDCRLQSSYILQPAATRASRR